MDMTEPEIAKIVIVGGGPAGLFAADLLSAAGRSVILADRMPSVGRKFLVAGKGGLNLTHSEPLENFATRYSSSVPSPPGKPGSTEHWRSLLAEFPPDRLRAWAQSLEIATFIGTSGRVFPETKQAGPLLRRWLIRLRQQGVTFLMRHQWLGFSRSADGQIETRFQSPTGPVVLRPAALILAMGGGSWPDTGSNAEWVPILATDLKIHPLAAANCGYEVTWPADFAEKQGGSPLKNLAVQAGSLRILGELLITQYGLEGGALYQLGAELRKLKEQSLALDLKPTFSPEELVAKVPPGRFSFEQAVRAWRLSDAASDLLRIESNPAESLPALAARTKRLVLKLNGPRPIAEAISTSGGLAWEEMRQNLELRQHPGVYAIGEMLDWEAPTGGYLLQGCFATAHRVAIAILQHH